MPNPPSHRLFRLTAWLCMLLSFGAGTLFAQNSGSPPIEAPTPKRSPIIIQNANNQIINTTEKPVKQYLNGDVRAYHKGAFIYCDTAILVGNDLIAKGNVVILQPDSIQIFADSLFFYGDQSKAILKKDVVMQNGSKSLFAPEIIYYTDQKTAYFYDKAILNNGTTELKSQRGLYNVSQKYADFFGLVSIDGEDFSLRGDSLRYFTEIKSAIWTSPTRILNEGQELYSKYGFYNETNGTAEFRGDAQFRDSISIASADRILYDRINDQITLQGSTYYSSRDVRTCADTIVVQRKIEDYLLIGNAYYESDQNKAEGGRISFNKANEAFTLQGGGQIEDGNIQISALDIDYKKALQAGKASGNVIYRDTSANTTIWCDDMSYRSDENFLLATGIDRQPVMGIEVDGDSLFIASDTIKALQKIFKNGKIWDPVQDSLDQIVMIPFLPPVTEESQEMDTTSSIQIPLLPNDGPKLDTVKYLIADNKMTLFKSDFQAKADSLIFQSRDSIFTLFNSPFLWTEETQLSGDTIDLALKNKKMDGLYIRQNALVLDTKDEILYNQIGGKTLRANFLEGKIQKMNVAGNAQSIYYLQDKEDAYIGVNVTECSNLLIDFDGGKISDIRFYVSPVSNLKPMKGTDHDALRLKGFVWNKSERPQTIPLLALQVTQSTDPEE